MSTTTNLGQIQAVHVGETLPDLQTMIWFKPSAGSSGLWLAYNYEAAAWQAFAGEARALAAAGSQLLTHNLGLRVPGTVLAYNPQTNAPVAVTVSEYTSENTITVSLAAPATVVFRP